MRLMTTIIATLLFGLLTGCESDNDVDNEVIRWEGDYSVSPPAVHQRPVPEIPGHTTGDGLPYDMRTGGPIDGDTLTPNQKLDMYEVPEETPPPTTPAGPIMPY